MPESAQQPRLFPPGYQWPGDSLTAGGFPQEVFQAGPFSPTASDTKNNSVASVSVRAAAQKRRMCGADFTAKHKLNHHEKSHRGLKEFRCSYCGQEFAHGRSRDRHEQNSCPQRHSGV
ncbi:hypothetical protein BT96DRAFT_974279 [Gymnopus androsaceus JB14]|uniref:C2H2-type domain-containing protein n=1 Tax=Gymnopus androsaceus JB14 TaxID=1447944 RepID=A0A6A4HXE7_9AGAR|nr:hypothetical protein BT96DRAFT_974279 [Gymnopus androsaceus JB14]